MGKWSHLRSQFPARQVAVDERIMEYNAKTTDQLEVIISELDAKRRELKAEASKTQVELDAAMVVLLQRWEANGDTQQVKRESIGTLSRVDDVYASIKDMEQFKDWADENGLASLVKETVNAKSLASTIKSLLTEGQPLPESVEVSIKSRIRATQPNTQEGDDE